MCSHRCGVVASSEHIALIGTPENQPSAAEDRDARVLERTRTHYRALTAAAQDGVDRALQDVRAVARNPHWADEYKKELDDRLTTAEKHLRIASDCLRDA